MTLRSMLAVAALFAPFNVCAQDAPQPHGVVLEAELMGPLNGGNFSFQQPDKTTKGSWSLAGPGVAAEWTQGGESEFLSIGARADEPAGTTVGREVEVPAAGKYTCWVRYADYRKKKEEFGLRIKQGDKEVLAQTFGVKPLIDELDPMMMLWDFAFAWDKVEVTLAKGAARVELYTTRPTEARRHVDLIVLTTDATYQPSGREKPEAAAWAPLRATAAAASDRRPLEKVVDGIPAAWKVADQPPAFVWNVNKPFADEIKKAGPKVDVPFGVDGPLLNDFLAAYRGKDVPVYGSKLSGPTWHIPNYPTAFADGSPFLEWLERHPERRFALLLNYGAPAWPKGADKQAVYKNLTKYADRCVGYVAGESIAHEGYDSAALDARVKAAKTRGEVLAALRDVHTASVVKKFTDYYGKSVTPEEAWGPVISCLSADIEPFAHALLNWGCKRIGHENTGNSPTLARRLAFLRGAARQMGGKIADYQSANLGDSATMFSREAFFFPASSRNILDNSYDAWAGAGTNWLLKDYLLYYFAGCDVFFNEQGVDIFWKPGGGSAGDGFPVQLSPKGKVAEAVISMAEKHPRGHQYTPIAFLLDEAHGYSQERFTPGAFGMPPTLNPAVITPGKHEAAIRGWFDVAYFPAPETQNEPATAIRQTFVNGAFGDIFDVIVTAPKRAEIVKTYPVLIAAGDVPLTDEWAAALNAYMEAGGTLVACADTFTGAAAAALKLPAGGAEAEASAVSWKNGAEKWPANVFKYRALPADAGEVLATAADKQAIAVAVSRGKGKLIYVSIPLGLGIDNRPTPAVSLVMRELAATAVPIRVEGEVEKVFNRLDDGGWLVTVLNNRGIVKPQHGVLPTDYRAAQKVTIRTPFKVKSSSEYLAAAKVDWQADGQGATATITVPAGMVRVIEVQPEK
jgi:hypothetical protein